MRFQRTLLASFCAFALFVALGAIAPSAAAAAEEPPDSAALKAHLKALDSGPKTIDVTKYPDEQKSAYKVFSKKCSKCHTIARPINSEFVLPAQWERYIKRMMFKPNSQMSDADGKTIYHFLVYDASVRKKESLKKALAELPAEERTLAIGKIKTVNPSFAAP